MTRVLQWNLSESLSRDTYVAEWLPVVHMVHGIASIELFVNKSPQQPDQLPVHRTQWQLFCCQLFPFFLIRLVYISQAGPPVLWPPVVAVTFEWMGTSHAPWGAAWPSRRMASARGRERKDGRTFVVPPPTDLRGTWWMCDMLPRVRRQSHVGRDEWVAKSSSSCLREHNWYIPHS